MATRVTLPLMGEGIIEAKLGRWLKEVGAPVEKGEPIVEVETDKVTTELTADASGTLSEILVQEGEMAQVDQLIAMLAAADDVQDTPLVETAQAAQTEAVAITPQNGSDNRRRISPVVARIAKEHQLDLDQVLGTGKNGRVTKRDVLHYLDVPTAPPPVPQQTTPQADGALVPLTAMRRAIADHMVMSKAESPHATTVFEVDFRAAKMDRESRKDEFAQRGAKLTYMAYIAQAVVAGLRAVPMVNSQWTADGIQLHSAINLGIAAAVDNGLVVPVVRNAETLNLFGIAKSIDDLAQKARANQLTPTEMQGGTFTITNHGVFGSLFATPIINQPQCGILGVGAIEERVCVVNGMITIRPKAYFSFSFDHRILDGADADRFMQVVKESVERRSDPS